MFLISTWNTNEMHVYSDKVPKILHCLDLRVFLNMSEFPVSRRREVKFFHVEQFGGKTQHMQTPLSCFCTVEQVFR